MMKRKRSGKRPLNHWIIHFGLLKETCKHKQTCNNTANNRNINDDDAPNGLKRASNHPPVATSSPSCGLQRSILFQRATDASSTFNGSSSATCAWQAFTDLTRPETFQFSGKFSDRNQKKKKKLQKHEPDSFSCQVDESGAREPLSVLAAAITGQLLPLPVAGDDPLSLQWNTDADEPKIGNCARKTNNQQTAFSKTWTAENLWWILRDSWTWNLESWRFFGILWLLSRKSSRFFHFGARNPEESLRIFRNLWSGTENLKDSLRFFEILWPCKHGS